MADPCACADLVGAGYGACAADVRLGAPGARAAAAEGVAPGWRPLRLVAGRGG